jgi:AcrR family transcriptional regulator
MRADAARNHRALVDAARAAFEADGPDVALDEVARRAGVGPSTLYRRFAGRDELVAAVVDSYLGERVEPVLARAAAHDDPWDALVAALEGIVDSLAGYRVALHAARMAGMLTPEVVARVIAPLHDLVRRAQAAGVVRADLRRDDLPQVVLMAVVTDGWPRYLALLLDGLRPSPHPLPGRVSAPTRQREGVVS